MATIAKQNKTHICPWWLTYTFDNFLRRMVHPAEKILGPYVTQNMRAADLGCGFGHFSLGMAELVGESGQVFMVDLQKKMLNTAMKRAQKQGLEKSITPILCQRNDLNLPGGLNFILAANMVHEVPDQERLLKQIFESLMPKGIFYMMEPKGHMKKEKYLNEVNLCLKTGFKEIAKPKVLGQLCVVFAKD